MPKNAIVVGMARSGTSLAAGIFARQGYYLARDPENEIRKGDEHNPFGYWEADDLIELNAGLLRDAGYEHHNTWMFDTISPDIVARIDHLPVGDEHEALMRTFREAEPWAWKDPRLCYTLGFWWRMVDQDRTRVLLIRREPEATYRSFCRLGWCEPGSAARNQVVARVRHHIAAAERTIEAFSLPHTVVDYEDFLSRPEEVASNLSVDFDLSLAVEDLNVRRGLNHSNLHGRIAAGLRRRVLRLPSHKAKWIKRIVPTWAVNIVFPENRYVAKPAAQTGPTKPDAPDDV